MADAATGNRNNALYDAPRTLEERKMSSFEDIRESERDGRLLHLGIYGAILLVKCQSLKLRLCVGLRAPLLHPGFFFFPVFLYEREFRLSCASLQDRSVPCFERIGTRFCRTR